MRQKTATVSGGNNKGIQDEERQLRSEITKTVTARYGKRQLNVKEQKQEHELAVEDQQE